MIKRKDVTAVILAAGQGRRMKSSTPKVLHKVLGKESLAWVLQLAQKVSYQQVVVVGYKREQILSALKSWNCNPEVVFQEVLDGTGGAVKRALEQIKRDWVLILCGDMPLIRAESVKRLLRISSSGRPSILVARVEDPGNYGRVWIDDNGLVKRIVEKTDLKLGEESPVINSGVYLIPKELLFEGLNTIRANNVQHELYLTDLVEYAYKRGMGFKAVLTDWQECIGINSRKDLILAEEILRRRIIDQHLQNGVTIHMPETVWIEDGVKIGRDTEIFPFTVIHSRVKIGSYCQIGPFAHIRAGTRIGDHCVIGNFVEVNRSSLASGVYAKHLTYLGDTTVGEGTNIGAGTITANYDGYKKNKTRIGKKAFIGSGAILIAPVRIGNRAVVGAGAVVTKRHNVGDGKVVIGVPAKEMGHG